MGWPRSLRVPEQPIACLGSTRVTGLGVHVPGERGLCESTAQCRARARGPAGRGAVGLWSVTTTRLLLGVVLIGHWWY